MATAQQFSPQLRPLSVGEVLDASFKVVRRSFKTLMVCVLVVSLPLNIINTLILASTSENPFNLDTLGTTNDVSTGTQLSGNLLTTVVSLVLTTLASAACFRAVSAAYLGEEATVEESLGFARQRLLPLLWLSILYGLGLIIPFILLVLPGIWLAVAWSLSFPALLHEDVKGVGALGRSFKLVRGRWWPTFGALLVMYLIVIVISAIMIGIFTAALLSNSDSEAFGAIIYTIANTLSSLITLPLVAAVLTIIYFDLRVRKEGFDLQLLAQGVGHPTASSYGDTSPGAVGEASGLGGAPPPSGPPTSSGGFAPPQAPASPPAGPAPPEAPAAPAAPPASSEPPPSAPPPGSQPGPSQGGGLQSGDPLGGPPPPREDGGGASS
jgi:hypothetical protein